MDYMLDLMFDFIGRVFTWFTQIEFWGTNLLSFCLTMLILNAIVTLFIASVRQSGKSMGKERRGNNGKKNSN